jgi:glycosyltransferase involved in cell wall biosynthesis
MLEVVVAGPVNGLGYGVVCANVIHALTMAGVKVYHRPWPPAPDPLSHDDLWVFNGDVCESVRRAYDRWNADKPDHLPHLQIWHEWELGGPWKGPTIGAPFFETQPVRFDAVMPLQMCHRVIATSTWAKATLADAGVQSDLVRFVGVDPEVFRVRRHKKRDKFTYLHVGKYEIRKGIDVLIQAFGRVVEEYPESDLWLSVDNPFIDKWYGDLVSRIAGAGLGKGRQKVFQLHRRPRHSEVADLYRQVDAVVQPSRGEGFGLPALEALACGVPVAMTWNTGQEYGADLGTVCIPSGDLVPAFDGTFFDGTRKWRDVTEDDVFNALLKVREEPPDINRELLLKEYTWKAGAKRLKTYLEGL